MPPHPSHRPLLSACVNLPTNTAKSVDTDVDRHDDKLDWILWSRLWKKWWSEAQSQNLHLRPPSSIITAVLRLCHKQAENKDPTDGHETSYQWSIFEFLSYTQFVRINRILKQNLWKRDPLLWRNDIAVAQTGVFLQPDAYLIWPIKTEILQSARSPVVGNGKTPCRSSSIFICSTVHNNKYSSE